MREHVDLAVRATAPHTTAPASSRVLRRLGGGTFFWVVLFAAFHVYWAFGGQFGFGDASTTTPTVDSAAAWAYTGVLGVMFVAGAVVPLAVHQPWGSRIPGWALLTCSWIGGALLTLRGLAGLLDTVLRSTGLVRNGLTGLTYEQVLGDAHPSMYTLWSSSAIDAYFFIGGVLFCALATAYRQARRTADTQVPATAP